MSEEYYSDYYSEEESYSEEEQMVYLSNDKLWIPKEMQSIFSVNYQTREVVFEEFSSLLLIDVRAFQETKINAIYPPPKAMIGEQCFKDCHFLKEVLINAIPDSCFYGCVSLTCISPLLKSLSHHSFYATSIRYITIPNHIEVLPSSCFETCKQLSEIMFEKHSNLKKIENHACSQCNIKSIEIPNQVLIICTRAFDLCSNLTTLTFQKDSQLKRIEEHAFNGCPIDLVFIPPTIEVLADYCFSPLKTSHPRVVVTNVTILNHIYTFQDTYYETDVIIEEGSDYAIILRRKVLGCKGFVIIVEP
jgi:hypothetical protein